MNRARKPARRLPLRPTVDHLEGRALMATAGSPDLAFGTAGFYSSAINPTAGSGLNGVSAVAVKADGSIIAGGVAGMTNKTLGLIHLTASGALDTAFGVGGEADVPLAPGNYASSLAAVLIQPDGKIVVAGNFQAGTAPFPSTLVERFNADGTPDPGFGTNGQVNLGPTGVDVSAATFQHAALQADGKILLAGSLPLSAPGRAVAVARLDANGTLDTTYGTNGLATLTGVTTPGNESAIGLAIQPDGQAVVFASLSTISSIPKQGAEVFRLNASGVQDTSLSQAGLQSTGMNAPDSNGLVVQPDGKIVVLGENFIGQGRTDTTLLRLNPNGSVDKQAVPLPSLGNNLPGPLALAPNGDVVYTAASDPEGATGYTGTYLEVVRLRPDFTPDATFGRGGLQKVAIPIAPPAASPGANNFVSANNVAITPGGQIVAGGFSETTNSSDALQPVANLVARLTATSTVATPGDYTGDGIADPAIYLPASGSFAIQDLTGKTAGKTVQFGSAGPGNSIPAPGDYYGTGVTDIAVYLPQFGLFAVQDPTGKTTGKTVQLGTTGKGNSIPTPGDYYGTGVTDFAVYLPQFGLFAVQDPTGKTAGKTVQLGSAGIGQSIPAPGDYYGTGVTDLAVYLPKIGAFAVQDPTGKTAGQVVPFGLPGPGNSLPMPGDYDGSGRTEFAVYVPSQGAFYYRPARGGPDVMVQFGTKGPGQTLPMQGDYTGSGKTDLGVYLAAYGAFAYQPPTGPGSIEQFGTPGFGATIPVTTTVLNPFPGTTTPGPGVNSIGVGGVLGQLDILDFLPEVPVKKPKG